VAERFAIKIAPKARRQLLGLPEVSRRRIGLAIRRLAERPRPPGAKLLAGGGDERTWRLRVGDYRVLYEIRDEVLLVLVIRIGHRREVYRER
jgi:mRNA interferase RelE/StbE